jgi:hypothetical protein
MNAKNTLRIIPLLSAFTFLLLFSAATDVSARSNSMLRIMATDSIPPVITLIGADTVYHCLDSIYIDPGATASDNSDPNVTANIMVTGNVNTAALGTYLITYNVMDSSGNPATPVHRVVIVIDCESPVISLIGGDTITICKDSAFTDPGATVTDNHDTNLMFNVSGTVDIHTIGIYFLTYNATDAAGNAANPVQRAVRVINCALGVNVPEGIGSLNVYPNPANRTFHVSMPGLNNHRMIAVYNALGEKIEVEITDLSEGIFLVEMDAAAGIYYLRVEHNNSIVNKRISILK